MVIFCGCLFIGLLVVTVLTETLNCVFVFFCLDQRLRALNLQVVDQVPRDLRVLFDQV